jgi:hypothetical protein
VVLVFVMADEGSTWSACAASILTNRANSILPQCSLYILNSCPVDMIGRFRTVKLFKSVYGSNLHHSVDADWFLATT